jgi:DNA-binding HxlR family transcriptional regulator
VSGDLAATLRSPSIGNVGRILGAGAAGSILLSLGKGPLRTKQVTRRLSDYAPRTVYRYLDRLVELDLVERQQEPGVPSRVVYRLNEPAGRELYRLLGRFAEGMRDPLRRGVGQPRSWTSLSLVSELWELGMVEELSREPRSPTELAGGKHALTYHQIIRRAHLFAAKGLLAQGSSGGRHTRYTLTPEARRLLAVLAGIGRWRARHLLRDGSDGFTADEMVTLLLAVLPVVQLPEHTGSRFRFTVEASGAKVGTLASIGRDGRLRCSENGGGDFDARAGGHVRTWLAAIVDGNRGRMSVGGRLEAVDACLRRLHEQLWRTPHG